MSEESCRIMQLPAVEQVAAAMTAIRYNPCNRPPVEYLVDMLPTTLAAVMGSDSVQLPGFLAVLTKKYWGVSGVDLTVGFMEQLSAELRDRILSHMNAWGEFSNVRFRWSTQSPQVRITREGEGYWSYLGTDILSIPMTKPTMSLQGFTMAKPESEFRRVVRHEAGHTLGFPHEHMRREIVNRLDPEKTIAWGFRTMGWSANMVRQQILTPLEESSLLGTEGADDDSIMCYQLPASITRDGRPIPGGVDIDAEDRKFAAKIYPPVGQPPPPPPPPPPPKENKMYAYPKFSDVLVAIPVITPILRGGKISTAEGAQAGWVVVGYGLSVILPSGASFAPPTGPVAQSDLDHVADELDKLVTSASQGLQERAQAQFAALPWGLIVQLLIKLLLEYLGGAPLATDEDGGTGDE